MQNIECTFGCVARSAVLLKPNVNNILLFNFCEQKFVEHGLITIAIDCNGLSVLIFKERCSNYAFGPKSAPNSDSFWVRWLFNLCVRDFCAPNATILLVWIPAKIKMSFTWEDDFILAKSAGPLSTLDGQLASIPEPIEFCMASYQGLYAKFVSIISPKCSIVENNGELMLMGHWFGLSMKMPVSFTFFTR